MQVLIQKMIEKIKNPYVIFDKETQIVIFSNDIAKKHIGNENGDIDLTTVFKTLHIFDSPLEEAKTNSNPIQIPDVAINRGLSNDIRVENIYLGYFDDEQTQVFLEFEPKYNFSRTFEALQELSDDILFFVEIETRSMVLRGDLGGKIDVQPKVNNYPKSLIEEGVIHVDDIEHYLQTAEDTLNGINCECEFRVKMSDGAYNWFSKTSIIVHDDYGKPIKVLGKLTNIQEDRKSVV